MAYLGRGIENLSDRVVLDSLTASATASYTLQLNSVNFVPSSASSLTVSLNGVIQKPDSSYTVSGSTLTFSSALTSSDSIDFIIAERGITLQTPSAGSVNTDQLASSAVTNAKIASDAAIATTKLGTGAIIQVVQGSKTAFTSTTSTSFSGTGVKATITPSSTSSKVLVQVSLNGVDSPGGTTRNTSFKIYRDGSLVQAIIDGYGYSSDIRVGNVSYSMLASPSTTSATEFEVYFAEQGGSGNAVGINQYASGTGVSSTIILMEIAG